MLLSLPAQLHGIGVELRERVDVRLAAQRKERTSMPRLTNWCNTCRWHEVRCRGNGRFAAEEPFCPQKFELDWEDACAPFRRIAEAKKENAPEPAEAKEDVL